MSLTKAQAQTLKPGDILDIDHDPDGYGVFSSLSDCGECAYIHRVPHPGAGVLPGLHIRDLSLPSGVKK